MILSPLPKLAFLDNNGRPLAGGLLFTYQAGTNTKVDTYQNEGGTPNTNPIVLDFRAEASVWLDPEQTYKFVLAPRTDTDPPTNPIWSVDDIAGGLTVQILTQQFLGRIIYPRTQAEIDAGVTPTFYIYPEGNVKRYGATGNGVTDDTTACQTALNVGSFGGNSVYFPEGRYRITANLVIDTSSFNNLTIAGDPWKSIILHGGGIRAFEITGAISSQINLLYIRDLYFDADGNSSAQNAIYFNGYAGRSVVEHCYFSNYDLATGTFVERGYPIRLNGGEIGLISVTKCQMGNGWGGIAITAANGVIIDDNIIEALNTSSGPAIYVDSAGNGIAITNNVIQTVGYGVLMAVATGIEISGNYFEGCAVASMYLGTSSQVRGCRVGGNVYAGLTGTHHIIVDFCHGLDITGNQFNTDGSVGIIKIAGSGSTIGVFIGVNGVSAAMVSGGTYTLLTETAPLADGQWWDIKNVRWRYGSNTRHYDLIGASGREFVARNSTNAGIQYVGGATNVTMTDNQTMTFTIGTAAVISAIDNTAGKSGLFWADFASATIVELGDTSTFWATTNTDLNPGMAIFKSAGSSVVSIKNYSNASINISVNILGTVSAATAPA